MSFSDTTLTMPVQPANNYSGYGMFGQEWIWIIVLFLFAGGWGRGWGGNDGATPYATSAATQADIQRGFDTQGIRGKLDALGNGICDSSYALNNAVTGGFSNLQLQLCNMQAANQQCCCETQRLVERGFADTNYNLATQSCETRNVIQSGTRDIIENQNANSRAILDYLTSEKIDTLRTKLTQAEAQLSQLNQTNNLINALRPCPTPAYVTCNPWAGQPYGSCVQCAG